MKSSSEKRSYVSSKESYAKILTACETGSKTCDEIIAATGLTIWQVRHALEVHDRSKYKEIFTGKNGSVLRNYERIIKAINEGCGITAKEISSRTDISVASIKTALRRYNWELYKKVFSGKSYKAERHYELMASAAECGHITSKEIQKVTGLNADQIRYANKKYGDGTIQL